MTNTEISDNNPEKELKIDKSISDVKTKQISKKNTTQNKKIFIDCFKISEELKDKKLVKDFFKLSS